MDYSWRSEWVVGLPYGINRFFREYRGGGSYCVVLSFLLRSIILIYFASLLSLVISK